MPIVKAAEEIRNLEPGQILKIVATDEAAEEDFKAWARKTGNTFLDSRREGEVLEIYIRKS
jgi:tRNA 2-thiouridine synthesizing protein A